MTGPTAVGSGTVHEGARPATTGAEPAASSRPSVRRYDFRVPDKFPRDLLRQITHLHDGMGRTLTTSLSAQLRATVRVEEAVAEQRTYQEFVREAADPAILAAFSADPLPGSALLEVDPVIAFPMIDRMLGGSGDGGVMNRPITEIELTVIHRVLSTVLDNWRDAWTHIATLRPRVLGIETNPLFTQLVGPNEIVLSVSMICGLGRQEGRLRMCFPYSMLEPLMQRLMARQWTAAAAEPPGSRSADIRYGLAEVAVPVSVEIGKTRLALGRILGMRPGDLLNLGVPASAPARVLVRGVPKFRARVGSRGRHLAVQILDVEEGV